MARNIFFLGLDALSRRVLESVRDPDQYRFHSLLATHELVRASDYSFQALLEQARAKLARLDGAVDGIANVWDFPSTCLASVLCAERGLPSPSARSVAVCSHKLWSRQKQQEVIPDCVPEFQAVDPYALDPLSSIRFDFPFFLKPVKSYAGFLGFHVSNEEDFRTAVAIIRVSIRRYGEPFQEFLDHVGVDIGSGGVDACWCIAEKVVGGHQCTVEGFSFSGHVETYGVVDSFRFPGQTVFSHYQYPSQLPRRVCERIHAATVKVIEHMGYDGGAFNIEYFYDRRSDRLWLLEINPRVSQSHSDLFRKVDGEPNHQVILDLALGRRPRMPRRKGRYPVAGKLFLREFRDGRVTAVPSRRRVREVEARYSDTLMTLAVKRGQRLSELRDQDPYSYQLGALYMGARTSEELIDMFERCREDIALRVEMLAGAPLRKRPLGHLAGRVSRPTARPTEPHVELGR